MDFRERAVDFRGADRRYAELERQRAAGAIDERQVDTHSRRLMLQDDEGRWWIRSRETGEWLYHDGNAWARGTPPGYREEGVPEPAHYFEEADRRYAQLKRRHETGQITEEEFDEQLKRLMVQDEGGRWWAKARQSGEWHYHDGETWVRGIPPRF